MRTISISYQSPTKLGFVVLVAYRLCLLLCDRSNWQPLGPRESRHSGFVAFRLPTSFFAFQESSFFQHPFQSFLDPKRIGTGVDSARPGTAPERTDQAVHARTSVLEASKRATRHCTSEEAVQRSVQPFPGFSGRVVAHDVGQCASCSQARCAQGGWWHRRTDCSAVYEGATRPNWSCTSAGRMWTKSTVHRVGMDGKAATKDATRAQKMLLVSTRRVQASESTGASTSAPASSSSSNRCSSRAFFST